MKRRIARLVGTLALIVAAGCGEEGGDSSGSGEGSTGGAEESSGSQSGDDSGTEDHGATMGAETTSGGDASGTGAEEETGAEDTAGTGGSGTGTGSGTDGTDGGTGTTGGAGCAAADIIIAVDNSGSMADELSLIMSSIADIASNPGSLDVRYVLVTAKGNGNNGICAPPPLGGGQCPDDDDPPTFVHPDYPIINDDALGEIVRSYVEYEGILRTNSRKHILVVSDGESAVTANDFETALLALDPPRFEGYMFHGIYAFPSCNTGATPGLIYEGLVDATGGTKTDICQFSFGDGFGTVAAAVAAAASEPCH